MIAFVIIFAHRRSLPDLAGCADFLQACFQFGCCIIMKKIGIDDDGFGHCCFRKYFSIFSTFLFLFRI